MKVINRGSVIRPVNLVLRKCEHLIPTKRFVVKILSTHGIRKLDLGGGAPAEGFITQTLSPIYPYGVPMLAKKTWGFEEQEQGEIAAVERELTAPAVVLNFDALGVLPFENESLDFVNMSHFLEHFDLDEGTSILKEVFRILRPGGIVRISCPDLRKYAEAYLRRDDRFFERVGRLPFCNYQSLPSYGCKFISKAYDNHNGHKWFYDAESVLAIGHQIGFRDGMETAVQESRESQVCKVEPKWRAIESFFVELAK